MKVVILAGGYGTRLSEETVLYPKPMLDIGGKPILWHIMKIYSSFGYNDFIILLGYKGYMIKEYFANYFLHQSDIRIDLSSNNISYLSNKSEPWTITLLDTGIDTMTGGRLLRAQKYIGDAPFMLTYGDGLSDIDIKKLVEFHYMHGKTVTVTSVQPEGRFGMISSDRKGEIIKFQEKAIGDDAWVNAGFFVCNPAIFEYLQNGDDTILEKEPMELLVQEQQLYSYQHKGFWKCMDTLRDKNQLNNMWNNNQAKWKKWN